MIVDGYVIPIAGAGPNCSGITPEGTVNSFTSRSLIGSSDRSSTSALPVTRKI